MPARLLHVNEIVALCTGGSAALPRFVRAPTMPAVQHFSTSTCSRRPCSCRRVRTRLAAALVFLTVMAGALLPARPSAALDADAHRTITLRALRGVADVDFVMTPQPKELIEFYRWLAFAMAKGGEQHHQKQFQERFPDPTDFDSIGARNFLGLSMSGRADVWAMTRFSSNHAEQRLNLVSIASAYPQTDLRCVDAVQMDKDGKPVLNADASPVPRDPLTLPYGPAVGKGSDAWAHDSLALAAPNAVTDLADPDPVWRVPGQVGAAPVNFAASLAQTHVDLAAMARIWGDMLDQVVGEQIATIWLGGAIHFVQDAALPTATSESGGPQFSAEVDAGHWRSVLSTAGGYLGDLLPRLARQHRVRRNLDLLGQRWLRAQLGSFELRGEAHPLIRAAIEGISDDDPELKRVLLPRVRPWLNGARFTEPWTKGRGGATAIVEVTSAMAAREAGAMFDLLSRMAAPEVARGDVELLEIGDVGEGSWAQAEADWPAQQRDALAGFMARTIARAAIGTRLTHAVWLNSNSDSSARRLQDGRLSYLAESDKRRASWLQSPVYFAAPMRVPPWQLALVIGGLLAPLALLVWRWRRRRRAA